MAMTRLQRKSKVVTREKEADLIQRGRIRKQMMRCHSFRKIFNTICIKNNVNHYIKETLMGHKKELGLDLNYLRLSEDQLLDEYNKVIPDLTIDKSDILKKENQELKSKDDYNKYLIDKKMKEMEEHHQYLTSQLNHLAKQVQDIHYTRKKLDTETLHRLKTGSDDDREEIIIEGRLQEYDREEKHKQELANIMIKQGILTEEQWQKQLEEEYNSRAGKNRREVIRTFQVDLNHIKNNKINNKNKHN